MIGKGQRVWQWAGKEKRIQYKYLQTAVHLWEFLSQGSGGLQGKECPLEEPTHRLFGWKWPGVWYTCHDLSVKISHMHSLGLSAAVWGCQVTTWLSASSFLKKDVDGTLPWLPQIPWLKYKNYYFFWYYEIISIIWWFMIIIWVMTF